MIRVKDIMSMAFSYEDGMKLRESMAKAIATDGTVEIDFEGIYVFTTMFFNACSGHFVLTKSLDWYNDHVKMINLNAMGKETHNHSVENAQKRRDDKATNITAEVTRKTVSENT